MLQRHSLPRRRAMLLLAFCAICWSIAGVLTRRLEHTASLDVTQGGVVVLGALLVNALLGRSATAPTPRAAIA